MAQDPKNHLDAFNLACKWGNKFIKFFIYIIFFIFKISFFLKYRKKFKVNTKNI
jgi:hypothetical protein